MKLRALIWLLAFTSVVASVYPSPRPSHPLLVYNPSHSVPRGWYLVEVQDDYRAGDILLVRLPAAAAALAAQRGYLPSAVPLLKRVGATLPQAVCVRDGLVHIDGALVAATRTVDSNGQLLPVLSFCSRLEPQQVFVLSTDSADSFDGRYFGPIDRRHVIGVARPVWTS
jgi:conjugative transfer signal peptidase TraF